MPARSWPPALEGSSWRGRAISDAPHRRDVGRAVGIVAELGATPPHVDVDAALENALGVPPAHRVEEVVAGEDPAVRLQQRRQELELHVGEDHGGVLPPDLTTTEVHDEVLEAQEPLPPRARR